MERKYKNTYFCCSIIIIGICYFAFFERYLVHGYDGTKHLMFAQGLFQDSLEMLKQMDLPVWAAVYPLYHITLKILATLIGGHYYTASCILLSVANVFSAFLFRWMLNTILSADKTNKKYLIDIISVLGIVFITARSPLNGWRFYAEQCAANPVHNPTILFVRPFGIICFTEFCLFIKHYLNKTNYKKNLILFALFSALSILAKPSFALVFLPAMGAVVLIYMILNRTIKIGILSLLAVIPSAILLLFQFVAPIPGGRTLSVGIQFGSFSNFTWRQVICVSVVTFPVPIILFCRRALKENVYYQVSMIALLIGWLQMFCLTNGPTGDFSWGYDLSVQFATLVSVICAIKYDVSKWRRWTGYFVLLYQSVCGIIYMVDVYQNLDIWI